MKLISSTWSAELVVAKLDLNLVAQVGDSVSLSACFVTYEPLQRVGICLNDLRCSSLLPARPSLAATLKLNKVSGIDLFTTDLCLDCYTGSILAYWFKCIPGVFLDERGPRHKMFRDRQADVTRRRHSFSFPCSDASQVVGQLRLHSTARGQHNK